MPSSENMMNVPPLDPQRLSTREAVEDGSLSDESLSEGARLISLLRYDILDSAPEESFDDIARLAAYICDCPIALISLVEKDRQWFKSRVGLEVAETGRDASFCAHALRPEAVGADGLLTVPDAMQDERFADNPLVVGEPCIRFYVGAPLRTPDGHTLGTLCVIDRVPRRLAPEQLRALRTLSHLVMTQMELRRAAAQQAVLLSDCLTAEAALAARNRDLVVHQEELEAQTIQQEKTATRLAKANRLLEHASQRFQEMFHSLPVAGFCCDADGAVAEWNRAASALFALPGEQALGRTLWEVVCRPEDAARGRRVITRVLAGESVENLEWEAAGPSGVPLTLLGHTFPLRDPAGQVVGAVGVHLDITARKRAEAALRTSHAEMEQRVWERTDELNRAFHERQSIMESVPDVLCRVDLAGNLTLWNHRMEKVTGLAPSTLLGKPVLDLFLPNERGAVAGGIVQASRAGHFEVEAHLYGENGVLIPYQWRGVPLRDDCGRIVGTVAVGRDITERRQAEAERRRADEAVRESEQRLSLIYNSVSDLMFLMAVEPGGVYRCVSVNAAYRAATGLAEEQLVGRTIEQILPEPAASWARAKYAQAIQTGRAIRYEEEAVLSDVRVQVETTLTPICDALGECRFLSGAARDISERKSLEDGRARLLHEALKQADCDPLTGLLNHRAFHTRLDEEAERAQRAGTPVAVLLLDLDNFKFFNDSYGHAVGDDVLRCVAAALREDSRPYDTLARFGGDEFALLLPGLGLEQADRMHRRLQARLAQVGYRPPGYDTVIPIGASIGVAVFPDETPSHADALALADARLRHAKTGGAGEKNLLERLRAELNCSPKDFDMLNALVIAVDTKDRYTRRHSEDVMTYSLEIAQELGLDAGTQHHVLMAALLHDVGKIGVPDAVLRKPGLLTEEEFAAVRQHPQMGAIIVSAVPGFEGTLDAIRHHHERWDGGGYPLGLAGEAVPLMARLMAVADAFSAMTTDRPYRKGADAGEALCVLERGMGKQWDPACVKAFLRARRPALGTVDRL